MVPTQYAAFRIGEKYLEYPLPQDKVDAVFVDPLTDLDQKTRQLFQLRYLPTAQRVITFWKKMLPALKDKSAARLNNDPLFQLLKKKLEAVSQRKDKLAPNTIDEQIQVSKEDLQMKEAIEIVKDMIELESQALHLQTGTD